MSRRFVFAVPGDLDTPTGGYAYDRRMIAELGSLGWHADVLDLGNEFPRPSPACQAAAQARLAAVPHGRIIVIDGLALGVLPDAAAALSLSHKPVALVHHPLALETGLSSAAVAAGRLAELYAAADLFVLASRFEGYGMAFAEALAHGVPVIGTRAGALPETVPAEAGILVPPDDSAALAAALRLVIANAEE